jgi:hypothetical protein
MRVRRNVGADTPFPPEVPHALNPLDGVSIDYWLASAPRDVTVDVTDSSGALVRHLSSAPIAPAREAARPPHPNFWVATPTPLTSNPGTNRAHWDLRYDAPPAFSHSFEINANPGLTPASPEGPLAIAGVYTIKLTADGKSSTQTVTVRNDPHAPASAAAIRAQHALQMKIYEGIKASWTGHEMAVTLQTALRGAVSGASSDLADVVARVAALAAQLDSVAGPEGGRGRGGGGGGGGGGGRGRGPAPPPNFRAVNGALVQQLNAQDNGDMAPTASTLAGFMTTCKDLRTIVTTWEKLSGSELSAVNTMLRAKGRPSIASPGESLRPPSCS